MELSPGFAFLKMRDVMTGETHDFANLWAVHSETENQPTLRDWARSEQDAAARLAEIKAADADASAEYWVIRMTTHEVSTLKDAGFLPADA